MTKRTRNIILIGVVGFLVIAQVVPFPPATNPPVTGEITAPADVHRLLRRSCYDCHSNETVWPWYSSVLPGKWLVRHDVEEGRDALNFSDWDAYTPSEKADRLNELVKMLEEGKMPLRAYTWLHKEAVLSREEVSQLTEWARSQAPEEGGSQSGGGG